MKSHDVTIQLKAAELYFPVVLYWSEREGLGNVNKHSKNATCEQEAFKKLQWLIYGVCKFFMIFWKIIT